jgi:hypothetical protein
MAKVQVTPTVTTSSPSAGAVTFKIDKVEIDPGLIIDDDVNFQLTTTMSTGGAFGCLLDGKPFHLTYLFRCLETNTSSTKTDPVSKWTPAPGTHSMTVTSPWYPAGEAPDAGYTYKCLIKAHFDLEDCVEPVFGIFEFVYEVAP